MSFPKHSDYIETGVPWLGNVPAHWQVIRVRRIFEIKKIIAGELGYDVFSVTQNGFRVKDIESGEGQLSMDYAKYQIVSVGDFAMNPMDLLTGGADIAKTVGVTSPDYRVFQIRDDELCHDRYLLYILQMAYRNKIFYAYGQGSSQLGRWRLPRQQFNNLPFPVPPLYEQKTIANFLDAETSKIDALVAEQRRLIELLKEKRQAVISHAVTKGLNPNTPMKDSGIEWLGDVPEHWDLGNLGYALNAVGDVDHHMPPSVEKGVPYVMTGDLEELVSQIDFAKCKQVAHHDYERLCEKIKTTKGDLIMAKYATVGTVSYVDVDSEFLVSYSCATLKPNTEKALGSYLFFCLKSDSFVQGIRQKINTSTQENVGNAALKKVKVALPPTEEQIQISKFLRARVVEMGKVIESSEAAVELLQERRTALISAAVTGKIDVREFATLETA